MIDPETREKILQLKENGYTNGKIREKTGISLPSIRKIIREANSDPQMINEDYFEDLDEIVFPKLVDIRINSAFIVNLTIVSSFGDYSVWDIMRRGVPIWLLQEHLLQVFPESTVKSIMHGINEGGGVGKCYLVKVTEKSNKVKVEVDPITFPKT